VFTIFLEDSAGMAGTVLAFLGIFFAHVLGHPSFDALASIFIGVLLAGVAACWGERAEPFWWGSGPIVQESAVFGPSFVPMIPSTMSEIS
jgi:hypothetical protein